MPLAQVTPARSVAVAVNFTVEIVELALKMGADILHGLIVDGGAERSQHEIENVARAKGAKVFIELRAEKGLQLADERLPALITQVQWGCHAYFG